MVDFVRCTRVGPKTGTGSAFLGARMTVDSSFGGASASGRRRFFASAGILGVYKTKEVSKDSHATIPLGPYLAVSLASTR